MDSTVVDFRNHGSLTLEQFVSRKRLSVREEILPLTRRRFRNERFKPYSGYKTQLARKDKPLQEKKTLAVERTKQVVAIFQQSDELMLRIRKEELDEQWKKTGGK